MVSPQSGQESKRVNMLSWRIVFSRENSTKQRMIGFEMALVKRRTLGSTSIRVKSLVQVSFL